ncbi:aromatic prenyltransferase [Immersiella caudata]|uniref:Aromatic prenyltransferase n=1 Tax=Immersiella caudata TaxID=314043 RepID=A0AA39WWQ0_9PEZI|nr:aromatic prenyltransferase [Immersiella caudata]
MATSHHALVNSNAETDDATFWWQTTGLPLGRLLAVSNYTEQDQQSHLTWYRRFIAPALGPRPIAGVKPRFQPCPVYDGSPCELSTNFKERSPQRTVRFTVEATGQEAGTPADLFNQDETVRLLRSMIDYLPGLDLHQFDVFSRTLFFSPEDAGALLPQVPKGTPLSQVWLAFDLHRGGTILAKVYFMPILKWIESGTPTKDLVFAAARACIRHGSYEEPVRLLDDFLVREAGAFVVEMAAIDCIDSLDARIKVYLRTNVNTLSRAKHVLTLGGRLSGVSVAKGLEALSELWPILFRLGEEVDVETVEVFPDGSYCGCAVEMKAGSMPETKLHIPVRKIVGTDAQICQSLASWFQKRGHGRFATTYRKDLAHVFPDHDLDGSRGTHTFVSFSFSERSGVYMTMYYSTRVFGACVAPDIWEGYDDLWGWKSKNLEVVHNATS